jgi:hypothetical protein
VETVDGWGRGETGGGGGETGGGGGERAANNHPDTYQLMNLPE